MRQPTAQLQRGSVVIITLWTITLMIILVAVLASQTRLSAEVAYAHKLELTNFAAQQSALNQAEMELMMERMPLPPEQQQSNDVSAASLNQALKTPAYRYNGQTLKLAYPQADNIEVRIWEHAGKINLREISPPHLRQLLEKKLGGQGKADTDKLDMLMDAWTDWNDLNDGVSPKGAEKDYYLGLPTPYLPRNGKPETVEEILNIKGFAEVFADVDLDAAFTLYGQDELVNLNVATVEAMRLLPGLDDDSIGKILAWRKDHEFQGNGDVAQLVPPEKMNDLRPWINSRKTDTTAKPADKAAAKKTATDDNTPPPTAFAETVYAPSPTDRPQVLKINPYQQIPLDPEPLAAAAEAKK